MPNEQYFVEANEHPSNHDVFGETASVEGWAYASEVTSDDVAEALYAEGYRMESL